MAIKGIIFDLDGTIINSELLQFKAFNDYLKSHAESYSIDWEDWSTNFRGKTSPVIMNDLLQRFNINVDLEEAQKTRQLHYREIVENGQLEVINGFNDFFEWIKTLDLPYMIITNSRPASVELGLRAIGLWSKIDVLTSEDTEFHKPDPRAFYQASELLKVAPRDCLVLEDYPPNIIAAKKLGSTTIAIMSSDVSEEAFMEADLIIENYQDPRLRAFISKRMGNIPYS
ncbi:MAG: HAD family hydrolase [Candidatus Hodarchaeales archaeon]|jgi:HAD superfamily hydrolase (TIGR01509 family)